MSKYGIVVIGYNRVDSISRLLNSLNRASYDEGVDLIISIDNSGTMSVEEYAKTFKWKFGKKIIRTFEKRLGLRDHVLTCGNYINEYDYEAIIVLEDDLVVSPSFFYFAKQAAEFYGESDFIAGISLYTHLWNVSADRPFQPITTVYDSFFMQYPQSWGQVWLKKQWNEFYCWYKNSEYSKMNNSKIPDNVLKWPESSWLKYHIEYCIDKNKYFVYPFMSLSTNFADAGTHYALSTNKMQVPLLEKGYHEYKFPKNLSDSSVYDAYFENQKLHTVLGLSSEELCIDFYGGKNATSRYILTMNAMPYSVVKKFGLQMRPWEMNVIYDVPGNEIFLYDTQEAALEKKVKHKSLINWIYDTRGIILLKQNIIDIIVNEIINKLKKK